MGSNQKRQVHLVIFVLVTFFVISFLTNILGALNPSATDSFTLSKSMAGFLPFSFFIAYGIMSVPAGYLLEKLGQKQMLTAAFVLAFVGSIFFGLFPSFVSFLVSLFIIGSGMAMLQVIINPLLRTAGGEENYAFNSVLGQLSFGAASFISPFVYSAIVTRDPGSEEISWMPWLNNFLSEDLNWVSIYWLFAILMLLMVLIVRFLKFPQLQLSDNERFEGFSTYKELLRKRLVWLYFLGIFAYVGLEQGISYWMSSFLENYHDLDYETVGAAALGGFWGLMTIGGVAGLILLRLFDSKIVLKWFTALAIISLLTALFATSDLSRYAFQACGFFLAIMYPVIISLALNSVDRHHGAFAGILMSGIMGGAFVQVAIGSLADIFSLKWAMLLNLALLLYIFSIGIWSKPLITNKILLKESEPR